MPLIELIGQRDAAQQLGSKKVEPEHLALALLSVKAGSCFDTLKEFSIDPEYVQTLIMQVRMMPVDAVFMRFPRMVRDLARALGKEVRLEIFGENTQVDRDILERLESPLAHLLRNAVDHGIEPPARRQAAGKPPAGRITGTANENVINGFRSRFSGSACGSNCAKLGVAPSWHFRQVATRLAADTVDRASAFGNTRCEPWQSAQEATRA